MECDFVVSKCDLYWHYYLHCQIQILGKTINPLVTIHHWSVPHYINLLNHSWPSDRLVVSLIFGPGYFTFLYGHAKYNIHNQEGGGKRTNKHELGLAPSARREKFVTLLHSFLCICELSRACIRAKFPQSHQERWLILSRWPTWPLGPQVLVVGFLRLLLTALSCRLHSSADYPVLSALFCSWTFLPSSSSGLVGNLARKPFVWVLRQNKQRDPLIGTYTHRNVCNPSCHTLIPPDMG